MKLKLQTLKDLRGKTSTEIDAYIIDLQKQRIELLHLLATNKEKQTHQLSDLKRAIAQAKTLQTHALQGKEQ